MNLKTKTRQVDGIAVVDVSGRITLGEETKLLRETVQRLLGGGQKEILLNLPEVPFIDSAGIGELVSAFTSVRNRGGDLKLLKLTRRVHDVLQITKLYTVFDISERRSGGDHIVSNEKESCRLSRVVPRNGCGSHACNEIIRLTCLQTRPNMPAQTIAAAQ